MMTFHESPIFPCRSIPGLRGAIYNRYSRLPPRALAYEMYTTIAEPIVSHARHETPYTLAQAAGEAAADLLICEFTRLLLGRYIW